jgi:branched-chain amino acid transport system substrate-binding protein
MPIYYTPASIFMTQAKDQLAADTIYYGCDGFDGIESAEGFDINAIPQEVTMLSHFNSKATEGAAAEFVKKYTEKYGKETLNQFGASAYDCVYAIYNAMKEAIEDGKDISVTISASDLCDILKEKFTGGFTYSGVTGEDITWQSNGYVEKGAVKYVIKEATK